MYAVIFCSIHGMRQNESRQEGAQPRDGAEPAVLNRGDDLNQADDNARDKPHGQQRSRQPERRHQGLRAGSE